MRRTRTVKDETELSIINNESVQIQQPYGLYISGKIVNRTRRYVPKANPTTEIVTYTLDDEDGHKYYVDDFAPEGYRELGEYVILNVYVKAYIKKSNEASYTINIRKEFSSGRGESF